MVEENSKFTFGEDFYAEREKAKEQVRLEVERRTFSDEELESFKQTQFAEGINAGRQEILNGLGHVVEQLQGELSHISNSIDNYYNQHVQGSFQIFADILQKLLPAMKQQDALSEVEKFVQEKIGDYISQPEISIEVHPDILGFVEERFQKEGEKKLNFLGNEAMQLSDCRVSWSDGRAERDTQHLIQEIITRLGVEPSKEVQDEVEVENTQTESIEA